MGQKLQRKKACSRSWYREKKKRTPETNHHSTQDIPGETCWLLLAFWLFPLLGSVFGLHFFTAQRVFRFFELLFILYVLWLKAWILFFPPLRSMRAGAEISDSFFSTQFAPALPATVFSCLFSFILLLLLFLLSVSLPTLYHTLSCPNGKPKMFMVEMSWHFIGRLRLCVYVCYFYLISLLLLFSLRRSFALLPSQPHRQGSVRWF